MEVIAAFLKMKARSWERGMLFKRKRLSLDLFTNLFPYLGNLDGSRRMLVELLSDQYYSSASSLKRKRFDIRPEPENLT